MSEQGEGREIRSWQLPGAWLREQKLWRDVMTRVLAGVITAAIIYAGAVLLGYLHTPELAAGALLTLGLAAGAILVVIGAILLVSIPSCRREGRPVVARCVVAGVLLVSAAVIVIGVVGDVMTG